MVKQRFRVSRRVQEADLSSLHSKQTNGAYVNLCIFLCMRVVLLIGFGPAVYSENRSEGTFNELTDSCRLEVLILNAETPL